MLIAHFHRTWMALRAGAYSTQRHGACESRLWRPNTFMKIRGIWIPADTLTRFALQTNSFCDFFLDIVGN